MEKEKNRYQKYVRDSLVGLTQTMEMPQSGKGMPEEIAQAHIIMMAMAKMDKE